MSIPAWAGKYIGVEFDRDRDKGQDCWGLVRAVYRDRLGVELPEYSDVSPYSLIQIARALKRVSRELYSEVPLDAVKPFDIVVMWGRFEDKKGQLHRAPLHVGVMITPTQLLHIERKTFSIAVPINHQSIRHRIVTAWRYKGPQEAHA